MKSSVEINTTDPLENAQLLEEPKKMDIMAMLEKKKLTTIKRDFEKKKNGLSIDEFVKVMLEHLEYKRKDPKERETITLEIDVNGDETMEWEEFSKHIIELSLLRQDRTYRDVIKSYYPSESLIDREKHETEIEKVYYFQFSDKSKSKNLIVLERDSPKFKVYNANTVEQICEVNAHKGAVLCAEYLQDHALIATSSNDLTINFWDTSSFNLKQIISTPEIQLCLKYVKWNDEKSFLYTGGSDAILHYYDAKELKEIGTMSGWNPFFKKDTHQYGHAGPIGDILPIKEQNIIVTAGLDGKICVWDYPTHTFKKELKGHDKGVYSLAWADQIPMNQFLFSAGLDHDVYIWNTYVKDSIFPLTGHNHPLVGVKCLPEKNSPQVITADIRGTIIVWDVRNNKKVQVINTPMEELNSFCLTWPQKKIVAAGRQLLFFEYDEPKDQELTDEKMCLKILFNKVLFVFITVHPESIKVWDAKNGSIISIHRELTPNDITTAILDNRQRKLFVGDSEGKIFTVNVTNGAKMKKFQRHNKMITDLGYWTSAMIEDLDSDKKDDKIHSRLISSSREKTLHIHDENFPDSKQSIRYKMFQHKENINSVSIKKNTDLVASGADDGTIVVTSLGTYRQEILPKHKYEIKKVLFLDHYDCLVAADSVGTVLFYAVLLDKARPKYLTQKIYMTQSATNTYEQFPVSAIAFNSNINFCQLLLGDEFGNVTVWDVTKLLLKLEKFHVDLKRGRYKHFGKDLLELHKIEKNLSDSEHNGSNLKKKKTEAFDTFFTAVEENNIMNFTDDDITKMFSEDDIEFKKMRKAHEDGITWIEIIKKYDAFATSSFDKCCNIWSFHELKLIGRLVLGEDKNWNFKVDLQKRLRDNLNEAYELLDKIDQQKYEDMFASDDSDNEKEKVEKPEEEIKTLSKREKSIKKAKELLEKAGKAKEIYEKEKATKGHIEEFAHPNFFDINEDENDAFLEGEEDEENDYNILKELNDYGKGGPQANMGFMSKSAFKSKSIAKSHLKFKMT